MLLNSHDDVWSPKVSLGDIESAALGKEGQEASSQGAEKKGKEAEADEQNQKTTATATTASFQVTLSEDVAPSSSSSSLSFSPAHPSSAAPSVARWTQPAADWEKDMSDHMDTFKKLEAQMLALEVAARAKAHTHTLSTHRWPRLLSHVYHVYHHRTIATSGTLLASLSALPRDPSSAVELQASSRLHPPPQLPLPLLQLPYSLGPPPHPSHLPL